jgi:hypothetical protein
MLSSGGLNDTAAIGALGAVGVNPVDLVSPINVIQLEIAAGCFQVQVSRLV